MRTTKRFAVLLLLSLIIMLAGFTFVSAQTNSNCVRLAWNKSSICQQNTNYSAGMNGVMLTGKLLPSDTRWNGKYYKLSGYLIDTGECTILVVQRAQSCELPITAPVAVQYIPIPYPNPPIRPTPYP